MAHLIVRLARDDVDEITAECTGALIYGHVVVVEDDKEVVGVCAGIVEPFESKSARHGTITDDRHDLIVLARQTIRHSQAKCRRNGVGGMSRHKSIVLTLRSG